MTWRERIAKERKWAKRRTFYDPESLASEDEVADPMDLEEEDDE
jgi:hypothetical protein